jgi:hypothetical protein
MPPWLLAGEGTCGEQHEPQLLDDAEIAAFAAWAEEGAPEGEPRTDLVAPQPEHLVDPAVFATPQYVPEALGGEFAAHDDYRCFVIDPELDADAFVTAFEVVPGNDAITHHAIVFNVDPLMDVGGMTNLDVIEALDAESPDRDGYPCFGAAGEGVAPNGVPVVWAPGTGVTRYPDGVGARLAAGDLLVVQMHYNLVGTDDPDADSTEIRLQLESSVDREGFMQLPDLFLDTIFGETPASLAPGLESVEYSWELPIAATLLPQTTGYEVHGLFPHMHERGRTMTMQVVDGAGDTCVESVPDWDFHWHRLYFYEQPLVVGPEDTLRVTCTYDTRDATEPVLPGWGTGNEMCLMGLFVVPTL